MSWPSSRYTRPSAERLVQRRRWGRQQGNDRTVRVLVPVEDCRTTYCRRVDGYLPDRRLLVDAMAALESAVATLRAQLDRAEAGKKPPIATPIGSDPGPTKAKSGPIAPS